MTTRKVGFQYHGRSPESVRSRINEYRFPPTILKAYRLDAKPLCQMVRDGYPQWPQHRELLAELIEYLTAKRTRGRPPTTRREPKDWMERFIAKQVIKMRDQEKKKKGLKSISNGRIQEITDQEVARFCDAELHADPRGRKGRRSPMLEKDADDGYLTVDKDRIIDLVRDGRIGKERKKAKSIRPEAQS